MVRLSYLLLLSLFLSACIGEDVVDDYVAPDLRLTTPVDSLTVGDQYQFTYAFFNNIGVEEDIRPDWSSSDPDVLLLEADGRATALAPGTVELEIRYDEMGEIVSDAHRIVVTEEEVIIIEEETRNGTIRTTSQYPMEGAFVLRAQGDDLVLEFGADYSADDSLPGLYIYLTNNPNSNANALEIGPVRVFEGAHSYTIPATGIDDHTHVLYYCKPFSVKVGDGLIRE